ncbi:hypothetical protein CCR75_000409 [Bremia lactucae]|uniref:DUF4954 domain-containing protein n=1 Tax=Bremia lactucae TaxID=4779 RepID=A0A976FIX4_BRELC|nr:hypothetical protein CCR75_000409 [Bremia lactucae]
METTLKIMEPIQHDFKALLATDHVIYVQSCREIFSSSFYPLSDSEVRALIANGNSADDWSNVRKVDAHMPLETSRVHQNSFHSRVVFGQFSNSFQHDVDGIPFPCGVYNSTLSNVVVLDNALVKDTQVLRNVLVAARASVIQCGSVTGPKEKRMVSCSNGNLIHVGVELGGRDLRILADLPFALGSAVVTTRENIEFLKAYDSFVEKYVAAVQAPMAIIASNARVRGCFRVHETFVGDYAIVEDSNVANSTILSTKAEPSFIQMKCIVPDQEFYHGEGVFFGLGCNVKFPSNFVKAPYLVIATAVTTLPQLVTMPFALIRSPAHVILTLSPAINEIIPGWVLSKSVYSILRNENKYLSRNKSKRTHIETRIFRPEIIDYMKDARAELEAAAGMAIHHLSNGEAVYTDEQVRGLGKNYMVESSRQEGIHAYTFFIKLYALEAVLKLVESGRVSVDDFIGTTESCCHELTTLAEEFEATTCIRTCLSYLILMKTEVAKKAAEGKARDDVRGQKIIPDYAFVHKPITDEAIILDANRSVDDIKERVAVLLAQKKL